MTKHKHLYKLHLNVTERWINGMLQRISKRYWRECECGKKMRNSEWTEETWKRPEGMDGIVKHEYALEREALEEEQ